MQLTLVILCPSENLEEVTEAINDRLREIKAGLGLEQWQWVIQDQE